eukprot:scaffold82104_cov60-Phaeocystis_antarctica.AAC.1
MIVSTEWGWVGLAVASTPRQPPLHLVARDWSFCSRTPSLKGNGKVCATCQCMTPASRVLHAYLASAWRAAACGRPADVERRRDNCIL